MRASIHRAGSLFALALVLCATRAWCGTTGTLTGKVVDEKNQPLAGVNIRIEGQRLGGLSDAEGKYFIIGIPGGNFSVRANLLGYGAFVAQSVTITPDFTTELNVTLKTEALQLGEVRVQAERPLLQKDATGTTRFLSSDDIQKLPTRGYRDAAAQQTGVVNFQRQIDNEAQNQNTLIVRGGRPNEVAYYVDGFSQQDPLTGTSSTAISNNAIEEVVVMTGGFNPEYGRIMSGAVNVVTREGGPHYFGAVEALSDALAGSWIKAPKTDYNVYDASLGGPLWPGRENLTFYVSGERRWQRDRSPAFIPSPLRDELARQKLDPDFLPFNSSSGWTGQAKLTWQISDAMSLKLGGVGSKDDWRDYAQSYLFDLPHTPRYADRNQSYYATFHHAVSKKTFWTAGASFFETERQRGDGVYFDDLSRYFTDSNPLFDPILTMFWLPDHISDNYLQRKSRYVGFQASLTSQVTPHHQLKAGGDFQRHTLRFFQHYFPTRLGGTDPDLDNYDSYGYDLKLHYDANGVVDRVDVVENGDNDRDGPKHPKTFALYAQDKYEREGVIVNGGLRFDHINVDTPALKSDRFPLGNPDDVENLPDSLETQDLQGNKTYARISPRIGVAFPLDEKSILRFNFGQFYQQPNLQDLYVSYRFLQHKITTGGYFVGFGNPNLRPERTTAYEVGLARQLGNSVRFDATAYYKDVKDLVEITNNPSYPNSFSSYRNRDFATIKGLDLGFTLRPVNHVSANLAYSLSYAQGTGSVSQTQRIQAWTSDQTPKQTAPLDFDQRHKLSMNLDWRLGKDEGPKLGNGFHLFENTGINLLMNVASGTPFTPSTPFNEVTLGSVFAQASGPINSRYGPWTMSIDLKASRSFSVGQLGLEGYLWVLNLTDARNATTVYNSSGSPYTSNYLSTTQGQGDIDNAANFGVDLPPAFRLAESNPALFSNPRLVRFGIRTSF